MGEETQGRKADEDRLLTLFREADDEGKCIVMLMILAAARRDKVLSGGFEAMGYMRKTEGAEDFPFEDLPLVEQLGRVCTKHEAIWWGRYTCLLLLRRDRPQIEALMALMRRRIAA